MMLPEDLFELQFNLTLYQSHTALFQRKIMEALEFHTVPLQLLAQYRGLNLTEDTYMPRIYTSATWSASVTSGTSQNTQKVQVYEYGKQSVDYYRPNVFDYQYGSFRKNPYRKDPYKSFRTPQHPSFLFRNKLLSWSLVYLPTINSCWNYGFSCSSDELPILGLTQSGYPDPSIGYENKALMLCGGHQVVDVTDFVGSKAPVPVAFSTNSSKTPSLFPCAAGLFSGFSVVIRPFYLTNSTGLV